MTDRLREEGDARQQAAERLTISRASLGKIGEGDWTPQDVAHEILCESVEQLLVRVRELTDELELQPVFRIQVSLDGDDWPPATTKIVSLELKAVLTPVMEQMLADGLIRAYELWKEVV